MPRAYRGLETSEECTSVQISARYLLNLTYAEKFIVHALRSIISSPLLLHEKGFYLHTIVKVIISEQVAEPRHR